MPKSLRITLFLICSTIATVAIYSPGLSGGFLFDDWPNIVYEEGIRIDSLDFESLRAAWLSGHSSPLGRPIAQLSFALNYFANGFDPFGFKVTNLAIHLVCGLLVYLVTSRLLCGSRAPQARYNNEIASMFVTALWLLHPIHLLPVLHVVQRMSSLSALFVLLAFLLHITARSEPNRTRVALLLTAWFVAWPFAILSKESGLLLPLFALAWELILRRSDRGHLDRFARYFIALTALALLLAGIYFLQPQGQALLAGYSARSFSLTERLLTEGRVVIFYLYLIVCPRLESFGIYHDDIAISTSLTTPPTTIFALLTLGALVVAAWRMRESRPIVSFGIAWFLAGHLLESTILPLEIAHEHRNYLADLGILLSISSPLFMTSHRQPRPPQATRLAIALCVLTYFSFVTALRAHQFGDDVRLSQIEAQHHRTSSRAQYHAGFALSGLPETADAQSPIYSMARSHFELSTELDQNAKLGLLGLIFLDCKAHIRPSQKEIEELARRLNQTPLAPSDSTTLFSVKEMSIEKTLCLPRSDVDRLFEAAYANPTATPGNKAMLHSWHADYLFLGENDKNAARAALETSLSLNPTNPSNRLKLAQLLYIIGELETARELLSKLASTRLPAQERVTRNELFDALGIPR